LQQNGKGWWWWFWHILKWFCWDRGEIMGCICSKGAAEEDVNSNTNDQKQTEVDKSSVQMVAPAISKKEEMLVDFLGQKDGSVRLVSKANVGNVPVSLEEGEKERKLVDVKSKGHNRSITMDSEPNDDQPRVSMMISIRHGSEREAWPEWLTAVAGEAVKGWLPRRADSFENLDKVHACETYFHLPVELDSFTCFEVVT
jgi:hypothetical protein